MIRSYQQLSEVVGWITLAAFAGKILYNLGHFVYSTFLGNLLGRSIDLKKHGKWAVVTGATDGIGKSYAKMLAAAGLDVVLISRNPEKLQKVADEIKRQYPSVLFKTIAVDFTEGQTIYPKIKKELEGFEIGILVNNVGITYGPRLFADIENDQESYNTINCNVMSMVRMCHLILPQMIKRKRGIIINNGSITGVMPTPYLSVYGSCKAFVDKFSRDLWAEVKPFGVMVQTLHPGYYVRTNMVPMEKPSVNNPDPDTYVKSALATLGLEDRTAGYWAHKIQFYLVEFASFFCHGFVQKCALIYGEMYVKALEKQSIKYR